MDQLLRRRRSALERSWHSGVVDHADARSGEVRPEVATSWERSSLTVDASVAAAPVGTPDDVRARWAGSRLGRASRVVTGDLADLAASGDLMAAITDDSVTIGWLAGGPTMTGRAEGVHFCVGGTWAEDAVGTNALSLAHDTCRPATVFSAEHYAPMVHDWVCYSAPVTDPSTGLLLGVIDLSTTWERAHPSLLTAVSALGRCVEHELASLGGPADPDGPALVLRTLGPLSVRIDGRPVPVTRRQFELLAVLSLHPGGLSLDQMTAEVYGDHPVRPSTVKAELSHLRHLLGGRIGSRPYRLLGPVDVDHRRLLDELAAGRLRNAVGLYRGQLVVGSESPELTSWRHHIDVALCDAALRSGDGEVLWALGEHIGDDARLHAATLGALSAGDARRSIVAGRLAAAASPP